MMSFYNKSIIKYINDAKKSGFTDPEIKEKLRTSGYPENFVQNLFLKVNRTNLLKKRIKTWLKIIVLLMILVLLFLTISTLLNDFIYVKKFNKISNELNLCAIALDSDNEYINDFQNSSINGLIKSDAIGVKPAFINSLTPLGKGLLAKLVC